MSQILTEYDYVNTTLLMASTIRAKFTSGSGNPGNAELVLNLEGSPHPQYFSGQVAERVWEVIREQSQTQISESENQKQQQQRTQAVGSSR